MVIVSSGARQTALSDFRQANTVVARGGTVRINGRDGSLLIEPEQADSSLRSLYYPRAGIYVGKGASHSWLWLVELLDSIGWYDVSFFSEHDVHTGGLRDLNLFLVGGGDTYAIAEALSCQGARGLRGFIKQGGIYIGSCAGAYLLLDLNGPPFEPFTGFTRARMVNVSPVIPQCRCMPGKFHSPYNGMYVVHPVRESVMLKIATGSIFDAGESIIAPLYGGPAMDPSAGEDALAYYDDYTDDTLFLGDRELADTLLLRKAGVVRKQTGQGAMLLFGPHCEHPLYPKANRFMVKAIYTEMALSAQQQRNTVPAAPDGTELHQSVVQSCLQEIKKDLSNARIMAVGLESQDLQWIIGKKSYEPEKIRVFLEAIWRRLLWIMQQEVLIGQQSELERVRVLFWVISRDLRELIGRINEGDTNTTPAAERLFARLKESAAAFLTVYFRTKYVQVVT